MRPPAGAWSRTVSIALIGTAAVSLASVLAPLGWPFELFAHFRWQIGAAALALLLASLALRRPWMMGVACAALALQWLPGAMPASRASANAAPGACGRDDLRVVTANLWFANTDHAALLAWLTQSNADVIALQEVTAAWAAALDVTAQAYPYRKVLAREDPYGIAVLSRWPLERAEAVDFAEDGLPSLVATVDINGRKVQVIALHTHWPVVPGLQAARDQVLDRAAALAHAQPESTILLGDLNLTPYAPAFARLLAQSGLRDAFADATWRPTWQAAFWPLALPIDHVLVPAASCGIVHEIGPYVGSDHRPVRVRLRLPLPPG
jgi:endonuclease/exonuclease/phosphatase (EEP) superfamily protein YafD